MGAQLVGDIRGRQKLSPHRRKRYGGFRQARLSPRKFSTISIDVEVEIFVNIESETRSLLRLYFKYAPHSALGSMTGGQSRRWLGQGAARLDKALRSAYNQPAPRRSERRPDGNSRQIGGVAVLSRSI